MSGSDWPPRLTVEIAPVLRLFTGENFYSSADAALREAVLNAIDAIGRRREQEREIEPQIEVTFDRTNQTVTISDNGDGMNRDDLGRLFTKVGSTASQIASAGEKRYRAVGEFGIGALSYFLVSDQYEVHTRKPGHAALALKFTSAMLDGQTHAQDLQATRTEVGTTIILFAKSPTVFEQLQKRFSHWMRNVKGLRARIVPDNTEIGQGGLTRSVRKIEGVANPEWIEESNLGPPENLDVWDQYDGKGRVDVLYRGVFVERLEVDQLWGFEGAIHVDPKHFRPKLNREGFVGDKLNAEVTPFLRSVHPAVLEEAVKCIGSLLRERTDWNLRKAVCLWLAVPRGAAYTKACAVWDAEFKGRKAFRVLSRETELEMSVADLIAAKAPEIYLVPETIDQRNTVITQAIRVLRAQGALVVQGLQRQDNYMVSAPLVSSTTAWLLLHTFRAELPKIIEVQSVAEAVVSQQSVAEIYTTKPIVKLVRLGEESAPFVAVREEIWVNVESDAGKKIVAEICQRNEGHLGLWVAFMKFAPDQSEALNQVATLLRRLNPGQLRLGLVRRQYLRSFLT
jgi:hypothetical protein